MTDLPTRLRTRADLHDTLTAGLMRDAADEIERLTLEHAEFAELVNEYAQAERPEAMEILAADRDKWWKAAERAEAEVARLRGLLSSPASSPIVKTGE